MFLSKLGGWNFAHVLSGPLPEIGGEEHHFEFLILL